MSNCWYFNKNNLLEKYSAFLHGVIRSDAVSSMHKQNKNYFLEALNDKMISWILWILYDANAERKTKLSRCYILKNPPDLRIQLQNVSLTAGATK